MSERFNTCDVVQDLLPLYHDGVLSDASRCLVAAHLEECPQCRQMLAALDERVVEVRFRADSRTVLRRHRRLERRQALAIGLVIAGVLLLLMLVLGFGWQACAVVAAALLFLAALIVAPLVMKRNRLNRTLLLTLAALLVLIFACDVIYSGDGWETCAPIAALVVYAFSLFFAPVLLRGTAWCSGHRALAALAMDTLAYYLFFAVFSAAELSAVGALAVPEDDTWFMSLSFSAATVCVLFVWMIFLVLRYLPAGAFMKSVAALAVTALWLGVCWCGFVAYVQAIVAQYNSDPLFFVLVLSVSLLLAAIVLAGVEVRGKKKHLR